jgi:hypothetical protein
VTQYGADHVERGAASQQRRRSQMPKQIGAFRRGDDATAVYRTSNNA